MKKSPLVTGAIVLVLVLLVGGCIALYEASTPRSTAGVTIVDANVARLPVGETFILTHQVGKIRYVWEITYDGKTVKFHCQEWFCSDLDTATLCGVDCKVEVDGGFLAGKFFVCQRSDGAANVEWPWGMTYRPYQS
jgi:hypothetical protein